MSEFAPLSYQPLPDDAEATSRQPLAWLLVLPRGPIECLDVTEQFVRREGCDEYDAPI